MGRQLDSRKGIQGLTSIIAETHTHVRVCAHTLININKSRNYPDIWKELPEELKAKIVKNGCLVEIALGVGKNAAGTIIFYYSLR